MLFALALLVWSSALRASALTCIDDNANCPGWANSGECSNNPGYMLQSCKKSCGVCCEDQSIFPVAAAGDTHSVNCDDPSIADLVASANLCSDPLKGPLHAPGCRNGGACLHQGSHFLCECTGTGFVGDSCHLAETLTADALQQKYDLPVVETPVPSDVQVFLSGKNFAYYKQYTNVMGIHILASSGIVTQYLLLLLPRHPPLPPLRQNTLVFFVFVALMD